MIRNASASGWRWYVGRRKSNTGCESRIYKKEIRHGILRQQHHFVSFIVIITISFYVPHCPQASISSFQDLVEHISSFSTKVVYLGDQLESVNTPRARAVEAQKLMNHFAEFLNPGPLTSDVFADPFQVFFSSVLKKKTKNRKLTPQRSTRDQKNPDCINLLHNLTDSVAAWQFVTFEMGAGNFSFWLDKRKPSPSGDSALRSNTSYKVKFIVWKFKRKYVRIFWQLQLFQAADIIHKLHLIAQELPSGKWVRIHFPLHILLSTLWDLSTDLLL